MNLQRALEHCETVDPNATTLARTACINEAHRIAAAERIDNPTVWLKFILPSVAIGATLGYVIGRRRR